MDSTRPSSWELPSSCHRPALIYWALILSGNTPSHPKVLSSRGSLLSSESLLGYHQCQAAHCFVKLVEPLSTQRLKLASLFFPLKYLSCEG